MAAREIQVGLMPPAYEVTPFMRALEQVQAGLVVCPGDTLVLKMEEPLTDARDIESIEKAVQRRLPAGAKVLIIVGDVELAVIRGTGT
jgi:hypothetical protein